jgi:hypothetical protein
VAEGETSELPEDPWDELIHQGDVFPESVRAVPAILDALEAGTDDDASWLYLLAAMCVGRPKRRAAEIREAARAGAATYRQLLADAGADVRDGAIGVLVAAKAVKAEDRRRFVTMARDDPDTRVRGSAALALGIGEGSESELERLLDDPDVRHPAALALAQREHVDDLVVRILAEELIATADRPSPTELPPWDALYPDWTRELSSLGDAARPAIPLLLDALPHAPPWLGVNLVEAALDIAGRDEALRREIAASLVDTDRPWERADELEYRLGDRGLAPGRDELRDWLAG